MYTKRDIRVHLYVRVHVSQVKHTTAELQNNRDNRALLMTSPRLSLTGQTERVEDEAGEHERQERVAT